MREAIFNNVFKPFDYYPFEMIMPGRSYTATSSYRFGFNKGSEKDNEIYGEGNAYTTQFRELDTRLGGRWWSIDPKIKAYESGYVGFSNNPIFYNDPMGDDPPSGDGGGSNYTVKSGDMLGTIAKKNNISLTDLLNDNANAGFRKHPDLIHPGEVVHIPPSQKIQNAPQKPSSNNNTYTWSGASVTGNHSPSGNSPMKGIIPQVLFIGHGTQDDGNPKVNSSSPILIINLERLLNFFGLMSTIHHKAIGQKGDNESENTDLFIAATAISNNLPFATLNTKHFERIESLQILEII